MKQRLIVLFFLFIWIAQSCFIYIYFVIEKNECQKVNFNLNQHKIVLNKEIRTFYFHQSDTILWEHFGKEFIYKGVLFDVVAMHCFKEHILVQCFEDKRENKLVNHIKGINKENGNAKSNKALKKLPSISFWHQLNVIAGIILFSNNVVKSLWDNDRPIEAFITVFKPPPIN